MVADVITSGTMLANLIKAGILSDAAGRNFIDMETGAFNFGDKITYDPTTGQFRIDGALLVSMISGQSGSLPGKNITLDGNTTVLGSFSVPGSSLFGTIDAQTIDVQNLTVANQRYQRYETPTFTTGSNYTAQFSGSSVAFGANSSYITLKDTGGRGEFLVQGTSGAYGSGYSYEMNAGGVAGGTSRANTTRMIGASASGVVVADQSGSTVLRFYDGAMYYQGKKIVLNTDNSGIHYE